MKLHSLQDWKKEWRPNAFQNVENSFLALLERSWESFEGRLGEESVGPAAITMATCMLGVLGSFSPSVPFAKLRDAISDSLASWQEDRQVELFEAAVELPPRFNCVHMILESSGIAISLYSVLALVAADNVLQGHVRA